MKKLPLIAAFSWITLNAVTVRNVDLALIVVKFTNRETRQTEIAPLNKSTLKHVSVIDSSKSMGEYPLITIFKPMLPIRVSFYKYRYGQAYRALSYATGGASDIKIDTITKKPDLIALEYNPDPEPPTWKK